MSQYKFEGSQDDLMKKKTSVTQNHVCFYDFSLIYAFLSSEIIDTYCIPLQASLHI